MKTSTMDDTTLLLRYAQDRTEADFTELVRRHLPGVYSSALRRVGGDAQLAEDVVQAVFTALALKASVVARHPYPTAWLYRATRNEAANAVRAERRRKVREAVAADMALIDAGGHPETVDWEKVSPLLDDLIDRLSTPDREAILRRFVDSQSYSEIGAALNTTPDAARMRVERALARLRDSFAKCGLCSTVALLDAALAAKASAAIPEYLPQLVLRSMRSAVSTGAASMGIVAAVTGLLFSPIVWLSVVTAAAVCAAGIQLRTERQAEADYKLAQARAAAAETTLKQLSLEANMAERASHADQHMPAPENTAARLTVKDWDPVAEGKAFLIRHPEAAAAHVAYQDARVYGHYAALFRSLNLTPTQIQKFEELHRTPGFGRVVAQGVIELGEAPSSEEAAATQSQLQALLGPDGYAVYRTYTATLGGREATGQLGSLLADSGQPLAPAQAAQLIEILNDMHSDDQAWQSTRTQAAQLLSPDQLEALDMLRSVIQRATRSPPRTAMSDFAAAWLGDPSAEAKSLRTSQVYAAVNYHALFLSLGLSLAQIQTFLRNVDERDGALMDLRSARLDLGLSDNDPAARATAGQIMQDYNRAQQSLLGTDGFNQLMAYDQQIEPRMLANDVVGGAVAAGLSFSPTQSKALVEAFAHAEASSGPDKGPDWTRLDEEAATFLSPEQLSYLKSADFMGGLGYGGRYQETLNRLITKGDAMDQAARPGS